MKKDEKNKNMKLSRLEWVVIILTAVTLIGMNAFFLGTQNAAAPVTITTAAAPDAPAETTETPKIGEEDEPPIDLNTATVEQLQELPSIGEVRAQAIVEYRREHGPFVYVEDLREVKGIGEGILSQIMDYVTVGGAADGENISGG